MKPILTQEQVDRRTHWGKVHLIGDRNKPIQINDSRPFASGEGVRRAKGGFPR
jgi:hypothetical protein